MIRHKLIRRREQDPDMTPMVDVTFLVLIFFMVTASFSLQRAIETPTASSDLPSRQIVKPESPTDPIGLHIDRDGSFLLMATDWEKELVGKRSLVSELTGAKAAAPVEVQLRIEVESEARLQALVDAIDAATHAGFAGYQLTEIESEFI